MQSKPPRGKWRDFCLALAVSSALATPARAETEATHLLYSIHWSGLHIANLVVSIEENDRHYRVQSFAHTFGIVKMISKYFNDTTVTGDKRNGRYIPREFRSDFQVRKDRRTITMRFDAAGKPLSLLSNPPEKRWKRKEVPVEERLGAVDAQTLGLNVRAFLDAKKHALPVEAPYTLFDGRRLSRMDINFNRPEKLKVSFLKHQPDAVPVILKRTALAGYTDNELERIKEGEDVTFRFDVPVSGERYPLYIKATAELGTATGMFRQTCPNRDACLKAAEIKGVVDFHRDAPAFQ